MHSCTEIDAKMTEIGATKIMIFKIFNDNKKRKAKESIKNETKQWTNEAEKNINITKLSASIRIFTASLASKLPM